MEAIEKVQLCADRIVSDHSTINIICDAAITHTYIYISIYLHLSKHERIFKYYLKTEYV